MALSKEEEEEKERESDDGAEWQLGKVSFGVSERDEGLTNQIYLFCFTAAASGSEKRDELNEMFLHFRLVQF